MKRFVVIVIAIFVVIAFGLMYFLVANKAPLLYGKVDYHVLYKGDLALDIYYPTKVKYDKSPVLLFLHGGAWIAGIKESVNTNRFNGAFNQLRANGYTVISPEYTLARDGQSPFPRCIVDGFDVIRWIEKHADSLNLDIDNFGIMGESAGAHIAMMNAFSNPDVFGLEREKFNPKYVVDIYGPSDMYGLYKSPSVDTVAQLIKKLPEAVQGKFDLPKLLLGFDPEQDSLRMRHFTTKYSPLTYLTTAVPPMLVIHGNEDIVVPYEQSVLITDRLDSLNATYNFHELDGVNHAFKGASQSQKDSVQFWIADFVMSNYSK